MDSHIRNKSRRYIFNKATIYTFFSLNAVHQHDTYVPLSTYFQVSLCMDRVTNVCSDPGFVWQSHMMMLEARSGQRECEIRLVEARLFYTVAIHIFCSHAECGHTVKQGKVNRRRRCRKMCLHSCILFFFWPCIFVDRIYILLFLVLK